MEIQAMTHLWEESGVIRLPGSDQGKPLPPCLSRVTFFCVICPDCPQFPPSGPSPLLPQHRVSQVHGMISLSPDVTCFTLWMFACCPLCLSCFPLCSIFMAQFKHFLLYEIFPALLCYREAFQESCTQRQFCIPATSSPQ